MDRAYSLLDIRAVDEDQWVIEGVASTPTPDRMDDIVEPLGAKYALPMPLLWQHDSSQPVGQVEFAKPTAAGIPFKASIVKPLSVQSATLKERLQLAWDSLKTGLVKAVSIGFLAIDYEMMKNGGLRFTAWEWLELSLVTIPANAEATITTIKSVDRAARLARAASSWDVDCARDLPIDTASAWDGPAATERMLGAAGFNGDHPDAAMARRGFLAYDAANPGLKGSYKLPFADLVGGELKAVAGGLRAAASRLPQTDIPESAQAHARSALDAYFARLNDGDKAAPPSAPGPAVTGKTAHVAKISQPARVRAPLVLTRINHVG